jgi:hypothetical protein
MFDHDEYHIYTTNDRLEKTYVHLTEDELKEAEFLHGLGYSVSDDWEAKHRLRVGDNVFLVVGDAVQRALRLESRGYEGWVPVDDGNFEEQVFFDTMIFYKCVGCGRDPEWSFGDTKEWVSYEHRPQFEEAFDEYVSNRNYKNAIVDW